MVSREQKRPSLLEELQILRTLTHSHAVNKMSIIADASTYIKDLKQRIALLNQEITCPQNTNICEDREEPSPLVTAKSVNVQALEKGFLISVFSDNSSPGLLAAILEAIDELGLTVLEARASCSTSFRLEVIGGEQHGEEIDLHTVELAVMQSIKSCSGN